jgi:pimeloyl-ACP methyl ester carboxylesterase
VFRYRCAGKEQRSDVTQAGPRVAASALAFDRSGAGEPLLLLHGLGARRRVWYRIRPALAAHHDVIAVDLPGFGESPPLPDDVPVIPAQADAVERTLDGLGIETAHIVGNSLGGWLAFELARRGRARSVVAVSPAGLWTRGEARYVWLTMTAYRLGAKLGRPFAGLLTRTGPLRTAMFWLIHARGSLLDSAEAAQTVRAFADAAGFNSARNWCLARQIEGLDEINCPVLIAWGSKDRLLRPRQGQRFSERIAGSRSVELPGLGHVPQSEDAAAVACVILEATGALPAQADAPVAGAEA